jgi:hypothetical protein
VGITREAWVGRILFVAAVVGALAAVADVAINWENLQRAVTGSTATASTPGPGGTTTPPPAPKPQPADVPPQGNNTGNKQGPLPPPRRDPPAFPLDFTLHDGEQRTFLDDQASVAAEFNQIGSEDFVTLRIGTTEGESVPHAVFGAGARFPVRVAQSDYSVYVLSVDKSARTVGVRISRNSESP